MPCTLTETIQFQKKLVCCEEQAYHHCRTWNLKGYCQWISSVKDIQIKSPISSCKHAQCINVSIKAVSVQKARPPLCRWALAQGQRDDGLTTVLRAEREAIRDQTQTLLQSTLHRHTVEGRGGNPRLQRTDFSVLVLTGLPPPAAAHTLISHTWEKKIIILFNQISRLFFCVLEALFHHPGNSSSPLLSARRQTWLSCTKKKASQAINADRDSISCNESRGTGDERHPCRKANL